jgi:hypothetical protein
MADVVLQCSDGHLFTASRLKLVFLSVHLGSRGWLRCPVDHKWRVAEAVRVYQADKFSQAQLDEATRHRF